MAVAFRALVEGDAELMLQLHGDPDTNVFNPYGSVPDLGAAERLLDGWVSRVHRYGFGYEVALLDGGPIGICGARHDDWKGVDVLNLYWRLLPEHWGRSLAAPLAEHALAIARAAARTEPIVARMLPDNHASARVAERLGLTRADELDGEHDGVLWIVYLAE